MQRSRSHDFGGQRAACGVPGNAGRQCCSCLLFIIPGHAKDTDEESKALRAWIIEIGGNTKISF